MNGICQERVVVITGAARGIGRAHALAFAAEGAKVVVNDIGGQVDGSGSSEGPAGEVVAAIRAQGGKAVANDDDVSDWAGARRLIDCAVETFGGLDVVVNNAGILRDRMLVNMSEDEWDAVVETHLKGTFTVFRAAAPHFKAQSSGRFVAFTSGAFAGSIAQANYASAKGGIVSLVRSVAAGMHRYGVTANAIAPVARTRMSENVPMELEMGGPEDVAPMVAYLLSDKAQEVTGQIYTANGGTIAVWDQPHEVREMKKDGRWTLEEIEARFDEVGIEPMPLIAMIEERRAAAASGEKPNAS